MDAAERLLVDVGFAGITARSLADEAGGNHGLIHYYFGSMEELFLRVLERFTNRLVARQREMYSAHEPYIEKWRRAMGYLEEDRPYQKIWYELQAMAWNRPEYQERMAQVLGAWRDAMRASVAEAISRYDLERGPLSVEAWITLIVSFNEGLILERLSGIEHGHDQLLAEIEGWLAGMEAEARKAEG
jgi:TetR/AcrR family transcriptional regulator